LPKSKIVLIDGNSLFYRSYYAIRGLSTSQGFPTNAVYGFITTLRKISAAENPDHIGVVFDVKGPTARHEIFRDYKANRKPMPDDLAVQLPVLKDVLKALRIPLFEQERHEADDVLATLAAKSASLGFRTLIVTTDKDLLQAVDDTTSVYNPAKDIEIGRDNVRDYFGAEAGQVADVLALWGDTTDNIPGVPGIGEKTAKSLIAEFGSLDALLENLSRVKNRRIREAIENNRESLELSRKLVALERNLNIDFDPDRFKSEPPDRAEALRLFRELEFSALAREYADAAESGPVRYQAVFEEKDLEALAERLLSAGAFALDTETDSPSPVRARLVGMSFAVEEREAFYIPLRHDGLGAPRQIPVERALAVLRHVLENPDIAKTGQNIKYDAIVLEREGVRLQGIENDTMVLSYLLEPNWGKHNLERLSQAYLQEEKISYDDIAGKGRNRVTLNQAAVETVTPYACQDADFALRLGRRLRDKVRAGELETLYTDIERPLIPLLARMEMWGVRVDLDELKKISEELDAEIRRLERRIFDAAGCEFNIQSPRQLADILFNKLNLPTTRKTKVTRSLSTSMDVLEELAPLHPLAGFVLDYRRITKLKSTYADALPLLVNPETGRIHTSYNQTVAATGRLSSSDPNLQNIPARGEWGPRFRKAFIPDDACLLLAADYSQIELRVLAHLSGDPVLTGIFSGDRDIHEETARRVFGDDSPLSREEQRRRAKIINFSMIYGSSAFSMAGELGTSNAEAQAFIDRYFETHPKVREFLDRTVEETRDRGYALTILGRKRPVPELAQDNRIARDAGRRMALNTPIQGSAADLIKLAMLRVQEELDRRGLGVRMILQVHDELVFEVPTEVRDEAEAAIREGMENVCPLNVPLKVHIGIGISWSQTK
jgi:DNA polymerase I